ncbi:hypothetical protein PHLGIDRAFT_130071 [Phlebiopsis gigantea 11061_1 CR5-6]|uniref:Uncharacterized protein n=1 Tax=Phlebiopsis gigantea (strain 11061_1 CR5-6) TaxID=745531 RepID=A0A0C3RSU4_PHLG1|nr:hypothetical protein PHLGIDRAFT_130071 [Phlebiopsis gigantea 11061_1 CR5-6]
MAKQLPLEQAFIVSVWVEAALYGFLLALFLVSLYINISLRHHQDVHSKIMFTACILLFAIATVHVALGCFRLVQGFIVHVLDPGPIAFFSEISSWHHVFCDTLMVVQEMVGGCIAIYRTFVIWQRDWRIIVLPVVLLVAGTVSGFFVIALYTEQPTNATNIFDSKLSAWISTFFALAFLQSLLATCLIGYHVWSTGHHMAKVRTEKSVLMPIARILIESAALPMLVEILVLALYAADANAQYVLLGMIVPIVAITFNAITIRIAWQASEAHASAGRSSEHRTIGAIPMRPITISIRQTVEAHGGDTRSDGEPHLDAKAPAD